jgi:amidase
VKSNACLDRREFLRMGAGAALAAAAAPWLPAAAVADDDFSRLDALGQAELVKSGAVSPRELAEAAIRRIERLNPVLNAVVATDFERALKRCEGPLPEGPFAGVPFLLKDLVEYEGVAYTSGTALFRDRIGRTTPKLAKRMEAAGLVVLGKTNTPEFGLLPCTEPKLLGPARNPWALSYDPGGSSGGAAVAVASGMVPMAQGGDGGGSIRVPSSNCGLFGIKVSRGRQPEPSRTPGDLAVRHVLTRSVRDSAAILQATALTPAEGSLLPPPVSPPGQPQRHLRIAYHATNLAGVDAHPDCVAAVESTARLCELLGHRVEEAQPKIDGESFIEHFLVLWSLIPTMILEQVTKQLGHPVPRSAFEGWTWGLVDHYREQPEGALEAAEEHMREVTREMARFHELHDVVLTPVLSKPGVRTGELAPDLPFEELRRRVVAYVSYTPVANATGSPAMSVPLHWTADGYPVGSHFSGRVGEEATLFALAEQLEEARPWASRRPRCMTW